MAIHRVTAQWSGFPGAPGYSVFHFSPFTGGGDADSETLRVWNFFNSLTSVLPPQVSVQVSPTVEVIDEQTGVLQEYLDAEELDPTSSAGSDADYAGPAGMVVNWNTNTVNNGRRVRGRTFLVPVRASLFEGDGTIISGTLTTVRDAAEALAQDEFESGLVVWSRPRGGSGGLAAPVTGVRVPDMAAVLRSRRD